MANITRWDPFRDVLSLHEAMDRLFEESFVSPRSMVRGRAGWAGGLPVDVVENDNELLVRASLPGIDPEDINVSVEGDVLTIRGEMDQEKEEQRGQYHVRERQYGSFSRAISLPTRVNVDQANAEFKNGVLTLTLPKAEEVKPKLIKVQGNGR